VKDGLIMLLRGSSGRAGRRVRRRPLGPGARCGDAPAAGPGRRRDTTIYIRLFFSFAWGWGWPCCPMLFALARN